MKRIFITIAIITLFISNAFAQIITNTYHISNINGIESEFIFDITITKGNSDKIIIKTPKKYAKDIVVSHNKGVLKLKIADSWFNRHRNNNNDKITVNLEMNNISYINLSGAASTTFNGDYNTDNLCCELSGASSIKQLNISGNHLDIDVSGAANCKINGNFNDIDGDISGAATLNYIGNSNNIEIDNSGAGNFNYSGDITNIAEVNNSGASNSTLKGKGEIINCSCSGAANINAKEFFTRNASAETSGASKISVNASNILNVETSISSRIIYYGNPKTINDRTKNKTIIKGND